MQEQTNVSSNGLGVLLRLYWMFLGNVALIFLLAMIYVRRVPFASRLDAIYLLAVASLLAARYVDIRFLNGETGDGKPATLTHWRRYALLVGSVGLGAWLLAHALVSILKVEA